MEASVFSLPETGPHRLLTDHAFWVAFLKKRAHIEDKYGRELDSLRKTLSDKLVQASVDEVENQEMKAFLTELHWEEQSMAAMVSRAQTISGLYNAHQTKLTCFRDCADEIVCYRSLEKAYKSTKAEYLNAVRKINSRKEAFHTKMNNLVTKERKLLESVKPLEYVMKFEEDRFACTVEKAQKALSRYLDALKKGVIARDSFRKIAAHFCDTWKDVESKRGEFFWKTLHSFYFERDDCDSSGDLNADLWRGRKRCHNMADMAEVLDHVSETNKTRLKFPGFKEFSPEYTVSRLLNARVPPDLLSDSQLTATSLSMDNQAGSHCSDSVLPDSGSGDVAKDVCQTSDAVSDAVSEQGSSDAPCLAEHAADQVAPRPVVVRHKTGTTSAGTDTVVEPFQPFDLDDRNVDRKIAWDS